MAYFFPAWAFLSGIGGDRMVKPEDAYAFQNTMLICIGVGFFASIGYHVITKLPYSNGNIDGDWLAPPSPLLPPLTPSPVQNNAPRYILDIFKKLSSFRNVGLYLSCQHVNINQNLYVD